MSTSPPDEPRTTSYGSTGDRPGMTLPGNVDFARMPVPGNAEFAVYLIALIVAMFVCWIADTLNANSWFQFFTFVTVAYILSRGIAKASRVLEQ